MLIWTTYKVNWSHVAEYFLFIGLFGGSKNIFFDISFYFLILYEFLNFCHNLTFSFWKSSTFKYHTHLYIHVCVIFLGVKSFYVLVFCRSFSKHLRCVLMKLLLLEGGRSLHPRTQTRITVQMRKDRQRRVHLLHAICQEQSLTFPFACVFLSILTKLSLYHTLLLIISELLNSEPSQFILLDWEQINWLWTPYLISPFVLASLCHLDTSKNHMKEGSLSW